MTDRFHTITVTLERDIRSDDIHPLMNAIRQMRGVIAVSGEVSDIASHMAETRAKHELGQKLLDVIRDA